MLWEVAMTEYIVITKAELYVGSLQLMKMKPIPKKSLMA